MNPSSPSQISSTTSSSFPSNDLMLQIGTKISTFIQNGQLQELSQFITMNNIPPAILTQFLSNLIDNPQNIEFIKLFLSKGADVNAIIHISAYQIGEEEGMTLLMYSIFANNFSLFNVVTSFHPNILLTDAYNKNAVVYSILFNEDANQFFLLKLITENEEAIHTTVTIEKVVHNLISLATLKNKKNFVEVLLNANVDVNYQTKPGMDTALHIAVKNDNVEIAELIYRNEKFNKDAKNIEGKTAKDLAKEIRGKVYYNIFAREHDTNNKENVQFNANKNENKPQLKKTQKHISSVKDNVILPLELLNQTFTSFLSMIFFNMKYRYRRR